MFWRRHELTTTSLPIYVFRVNNVPHYPSKYLYKNHELTAIVFPLIVAMAFIVFLAFVFCQNK